MLAGLKFKIYELLDPTRRTTKGEILVNYLIIGLIFLNTIAVILETVNHLYQSQRTVFRYFEIFSVTVFSVEYLLRLWTCNLDARFRHPVVGRLRFIFSFEGLIDLFAILPFYLPLILKYDLRFVRILRLFRFFRFLKFNRYLNASKKISTVFKHKRDELILSLIITLFLIIFASSAMYYVEHDAQPDKFTSIPETMWWSVATLTTVGYGDVYPITPWGKTLTAIISILGIGMFALPAGILASGFSSLLKKEKETLVCPHCGKKLL